MKLLEDMRYIIYKVLSPSGKVYIGMTSNGLDSRKSSHIYKARIENRLLFHKAINKYSTDLIWEVIEEYKTKKEACLLERYWIKRYKSNNSKYGYNLTSGGELLGGTYFNQEIKDKMSQSAINRFKDPEKMLNHINGQKKRYQNPKQIEISSSNSKRYWNKEENREKQSLRRKEYFKDIDNRNKLAKTKGGVRFYVFNNGEYIGSWVNQCLCAEELNLTVSCIRDCLKGSSSHHKGYSFNFEKKIPESINKDYNTGLTFEVRHINGDLIGVYNNQIECAKELDLRQSSISRCLSGNRNKYNNFTFKYSVKNRP